MFPFIGTYLKNSINIQQKKDKLTHMQLLKPSIDASFLKDWDRHQEAHS